MTFLSFILSLCMNIRPKISVLINLIFLFIHARPFDLKLVSSLIFFFYLHMTIRPKLGVTLIFKFIIFLIEPIFCLQYCLYVSSATIIPLYFVYYIPRSAALTFRMLYSWLYEVLTNDPCSTWRIPWLYSRFFSFSHSFYEQLEDYDGVNGIWLMCWKPLRHKRLFAR